MALQILMLLVSFFLLHLGAEWTLESAEILGEKWGMSKLAVGMVIIGFGTSLPEFFVSQISAMRGEDAIALGNIIGSNVGNMYFILGIAGLMTSIPLGGPDIRRQFFYHMLVTLVLGGCLQMAAAINWVTSLVLWSVFAGYLAQIYLEMRRKRLSPNATAEQVSGQPLPVAGMREFLKMAFGFFFLFAGGEMLVRAVGALANDLGIDPYLISIIFVALGTSLPELVTTVMACRRKKDTGLIIGNIMGSNIFNGAFILGSLSPHGVKIVQRSGAEIGLLAVGTLFLIVQSFRSQNFHKFTGTAFLVAYAGIVYYWIRG